jgi:hypothetical protein
MGRLTEDMTRLVGEIHAARDDRGRLMRDLKHATAEMKRAVAHLRSRFAAELAGARAAWFGARAPVSRRAGEPGSAAPGGREAEAEREDVLREAAEERSRLKAKRETEERAKRDAEARAKREAEEKAKREAEVGAKRRARGRRSAARDEARTVHKAGGRHRSR